ncbi:MAG: DUF790 family protein [Thaumarchaeota archaeon]|nr:DUF790 family protein [Nitrososphaerota archaeon]
MLPSELLRARTSRGRIYPMFCSVGGADTEAGGGGDGGGPENGAAADTERELASALISRFEDASASGTSRGELHRTISDMEPDYDYKLVRGLRTLLERRSSFATQRPESCPPGLDPYDVRRALFTESSAAGLATSAAKRDAIIRRTADACGIRPADVPRVMWADLEENQTLEHFDAISVGDLLLWYNMSLAQTLLFGCTRMEFYVGEGPYWKEILRAVKARGLMYVLEPGDGAGKKKGGGGDIGSSSNSSRKEGGVPPRCILEGPLSVFKMTTKYGTAFARLLPVITRTPSWRIDATISRKTPGGVKLYRFEMESDSVHAHLRGVEYGPRHGTDADLQQYDSAVEQKFADILYAHLGRGDPLGWRMTREPGPLISGNKAMLPDFVFERLGRRVYLEIVGFWTPDYIRRKFAKLRDMLLVEPAAAGKSGPGAGPEAGGAGGIDMLVGIDSSLLCSQASEVAGLPGVFMFGRDISVKPILDHLGKIDAELEREAASGARLSPGDIGADVIAIRDVAVRRLAPEGAVPGMFEASAPGRYVRAGPFMVSAAKVSEMSEAIGSGPEGFVDACRILADAKIPEGCHAELLSCMGYDVVWPDLDPNNARIQKRAAPGRD